MPVRGDAHAPSVAEQRTWLRIAVVSWNTRELLGRCLESLRPAVESGAIEVHVVDNASDDGSAELVRERFPWAALTALERNIGFGAAVNRGIDGARGEWVGIANADVALEPGALEAMLEAGRSDPRAGAVAPRLLLPDGTTQHSVFGFPTVARTALLNSGAPFVSRRLADRLLVVGSWEPDRARRVPWAIAAFLLVRRQAWEQVGGFDASQWMYAEDLDLGWRLRRAGWATRYEPAALVQHESAASTSQAWGDGRTARWQRSTYAWMLRRRGISVTRAVAVVNLVACAVRWLALTPAARANPDRWSGRRDAARWWVGLHAQGLATRRSLEEHR